MIISFRHKGLKNFFDKGIKAGIQAKHTERLRLILGRLAVAAEPRDMNLPGLKLHKLGGKYGGFWSVEVSGNWRVIFQFEGNDVIQVDYLDYH
jgi:proteic killer suppression protein